MKLYHLTTYDLLDDIVMHGLLPEKSQSSLPAIFLASHRETAQNYESMKKSACVVLEVDLPPGLEQHLRPDNYELRDLLGGMGNDDLERHSLFEGAGWQDCTWQQSLEIRGQVACTERIAPEHITVLRPDVKVPTLGEIVEVLQDHPLIGLREQVERAFLIGSQAKERLGTGKTHCVSDVDVLLEVKPRDDETAEQMQDRYRKKLMAHFMRHGIRGKKDSVHPQWCERRVDVYFTYDADQETRPKIELEKPSPRPRLRNS